MRSDDDLPLIKKVRKIFENSKFNFVTERINFWVNGEDEQLTEVDVCAILGNKMFLIECKSAKLKDRNTEITRKNELIKAITSETITKITNDSSPKLIPKHLEKIDEIYLGYYLGNESVYDNHKSSLNSKKILVWNNDAVKYFEKVSETLGNLTQNEILYREFNVPDNDIVTKSIPAIKFQQGNLTMHLFTLEASQLLKIGYVSRRGTRRDESYQRIINPNRLKSLANFITDSKHLIMANPIILAFDHDIVKKIEYVSENKMAFTNHACSAWIIDGQHRIFAFKDIDLNSIKYKKFNIQIPVVALEKSNSEIQSETFVNINYYQKKIESLLIYDLAASFQYLRNELVWPSLLTMNLNENGVLKGLIKTKELESSKPLQSTNFVKTILEELLGFNPGKDEYDGPLYELCNFNKNTKITTAQNNKALKIHSGLLQNYFDAVMSFTNKPKTDWRKTAKNRGFLTSSAIQAFLLVLTTILRAEHGTKMDFQKILKPLEKIDFTKGTYAEYRQGYPAINGYTKDLLKEINTYTGKSYRYVPISQIRKNKEKSKKIPLKN